MKLSGISLLAWQPRYTKPLILGVLTVVAYLAALNRMQAFPWAIAALLTSTLITGIAWPRWLVKGLSVTRTGPQCAEEGESVSFHVEVENHGVLPRFMVELVDHLPFVGASEGASAHHEKTLGVVAYVPGGGKRRFDLSLVCEKRGFYRLGPVGLASSFPLGLAEARQQRNDGVQTLTVYPDVFPMVHLPLRGAPSQIHRGGYLLPDGAGAAEFCGLREYRRGDNPRHVHWPTTARLNELMIKEFEPLASACLCVVLDQSADANVGQGKHSTFEYAVRIAASIAKYACGNSIPLRLVGQGARALHVPAGTGEHQYRSMLDELAVVDADGVTPYAEALQGVAVDCQRGETVAVFLSEPRPRLAQTLQAVALLRARGTNVFAVVFERETFISPGKVRDAATATAMASLQDLGASCLQVGRGHDLVKLFNP